MQWNQSSASAAKPSKRTMLLSSKKLVEEEPISEVILAKIERSITNMKRGKVSAPVEIQSARDLLRQ